MCGQNVGIFLNHLICHIKCIPITCLGKWLQYFEIDIKEIIKMLTSLHLKKKKLQRQDLFASLISNMNI